MNSSDFTVSCPLWQLNCPSDQRGRHARHGAVYKELKKHLDEEQICVIQFVPDLRPNKVKITVKSKEVKEDLLRFGLQLFGQNVELKDEDEFMTPVFVKDLSVRITNNEVLIALSNFGECIRVENEFIWVDGYKTKAVTGTRIAYMGNIIQKIPTSLKVKSIENDSFSSIACLAYRGQNLYSAAVDSTTGASQSEPSDNTFNVKCFTCHENGHVSKNCPDLCGWRKTEEAFVFFNANCPLSAMNTEYPFKVENKEYISVDQFVIESKCLKYGDIRAAKLVMDQTDPKEIKRAGESMSIVNFNAREWSNEMPNFVAQALQAKFTDPGARGAREFLLDTESLVIGEATKNNKWGIGVTIAHPDHALPKNWGGRNLLGNMLMELRDHVIGKNASDPTANENQAAAAAAAEHSDATSPPVDLPDAAATLPDAAAPPSTAAAAPLPDAAAPPPAAAPPLAAATPPAVAPPPAAAPLPAVASQTAAASPSAVATQPAAAPQATAATQPAAAHQATAAPSAAAPASADAPPPTGAKSPQRFAVVFGDSNISNLALEDKSSVPLNVSIHNMGDMSVRELSRSIVTDDLTTDIDDDRIEIVGLHVGAYEWNPEYSTIATALSVFTEYQQLLSAVCRRYNHPVLLISSIPLLKHGSTPTEVELLIIEQIKLLNDMLKALCMDEENIHFIDNSCIHNDPSLESLHLSPTTLNSKGCFILGDNIRSGIREAFGKLMARKGVENGKWNVVSTRGC